MIPSLWNQDVAPEDGLGESLVVFDNMGTREVRDARIFVIHNNDNYDPELGVKMSTFVPSNAAEKQKILGVLGACFSPNVAQRGGKLGKLGKLGRQVRLLNVGQRKTGPGMDSVAEHQVPNTRHTTSFELSSRESKARPKALVID